jgi:hypothetical protein
MNGSGKSFWASTTGPINPRARGNEEGRPVCLLCSRTAARKTYRMIK